MTVSRAARLDLRTFQQELALRLAKKTTAQVESSRLGLASNGARWLIRLADAGEVITVPQIAPVPLTCNWFLGVANIRGNLHGVVDFAGFLGGTPVTVVASTRLVLFGACIGELYAGLIVERVLGLRNLCELAPAPALPDAAPWYAQRWIDGEGSAWQEIDLAKLARAPEFLQVDV
jgi:twitching motility protein PilI